MASNAHLIYLPVGVFSGYFFISYVCYSLFSDPGSSCVMVPNDPITLSFIQFDSDLLKLGVPLFNYNIHLLIFASLLLSLVLIGCVLSISDNILFKKVVKKK